MRCSCAMTASKVTPLANEEGADVEGAEDAEGAIVSIRGHLDLSYASLHRTVVASMAHMIVK